LEDEERGVVGDELDAADFTEEPEDSPSVSSSALSIATVGKGCDTRGLKRRGWGLNLGPLADKAGEARESSVPGGGETRSSVGGGVTLTLGEETARFPLRTELLFTSNDYDIQS